MSVAIRVVPCLDVDAGRVVKGVNFADLRDVSPADTPIEWRFARDALGSPELGVSRFTYGPGARMPWGHRHREQFSQTRRDGLEGMLRVGPAVWPSEVGDHHDGRPRVQEGPDGP